MLSESRVCVKLSLISEEPIYEPPISSRELRDAVFLIENNHLLRQASIPSRPQPHYSKSLKMDS